MAVQNPNAALHIYMHRCMSFFPYTCVTRLCLEFGAQKGVGLTSQLLIRAESSLAFEPLNREPYELPANPGLLK